MGTTKTTGVAAQQELLKKHFPAGDSFAESSRLKGPRPLLFRRIARRDESAEVWEVCRVRRPGNTEAFEESLIENIQRADMVPLDEARAVARVASAHGVQEAARRLGKPHHWVSKRKRIAEAPAFVVDFVASGSSGDVEAFYELTKLADVDPDAAQSIVANHAQGGHLREEVKAAARAAREDEDDDDGNSGGKRETGYESPGFEPRLSDARGGSSSDENDDDDDDREESSGGDGDGEAKPSWLPSDAPELDRPFDGDPPLFVVAVEVRRAGHFVLTTSTSANAAMDRFKPDLERAVEVRNQYVHASWAFDNAKAEMEHRRLPRQAGAVEELRRVKVSDMEAASEMIGEVAERVASELYDPVQKVTQDHPGEVVHFKRL